MDSKGFDHHGGGSDWVLSGQTLQEAQDDAVWLAVYGQESAAGRIISDREQRRKTYLTCVTSQLGGSEFKTLADRWIRDGRRLAQVGRRTGRVERRGPVVVDNIRFLLTQTTSPLKATPGWVRSPTNVSSTKCLIGSILQGSRTRARTNYPRSLSPRSTSRPRWPVPPTPNTFDISQPLSRRSGVAPSPGYTGEDPR